MPVVEYLCSVVIPLRVGISSVCTENLLSEVAVAAHCEVESLVINAEVQSEDEVRVRVTCHGLVLIVKSSILVDVYDLKVARLRWRSQYRIACRNPLIYLSLILEYACCLVCPEITDRIANLGTIELSITLND